MSNTSLIQWLRKTPQPNTVRVHTEEGDVNVIEINAKSSTRWRSTEEAVEACRAVQIECLSKDGKILRARRWKPPELEGDGGGDTAENEKNERRREQLSMRMAVQQAAMIDRYGERMCQAFEQGAAAAGVSQESLVSLVSTLTDHLSLAITNLHNVSVNLANIVQATASETDTKSSNDSAIAQMLGGVALRAMGGTPPNGGASPARKEP